MSENEESVPETLGTHRPCPALTAATQGDENEEEPHFHDVRCPHPSMPADANNDNEGPQSDAQEHNLALEAAADVKFGHDAKRGFSGRLHRVRSEGNAASTGDRWSLVGIDPTTDMWDACAAVAEHGPSDMGLGIFASSDSKLYAEGGCFILSMSENEESIPKALGTHRPCPTQTAATQGDENEEEPTAGVTRALSAAVTEAPASEAKEKDAANRDSKQKIPPCPFVFDDAGNEQTSTAVGGNCLAVDSSWPSSGEKAKGGWEKDSRPATIPRVTKPGAILASANSVAASDIVVLRRKDPKQNRSPAAVSAGVSSAGMAGREKTKANKDWNQKTPPGPSFLNDTGNELTSMASITSGDRISADSPQTSSGERTKGGRKKDLGPATVPRAKKNRAVSAGAGAASAAASDMVAHRRKDLRPVPRPETISAGVASADAAGGQRQKDPRSTRLCSGVASTGMPTASDMAAQRRKDTRPIRSPAAISAGVASAGTAGGQRRKDPKPTRLSRGVASPGTPAARDRQEDPRPTEFFSGTAFAVTANSWKRRKDPTPVTSEMQEILESFNDEPTTHRRSTSGPEPQTTPGSPALCPAPRATPGAVAVPGINSDSDDIETMNHEHPSQEIPPGMGSDIGSTAAPSEETLQTPIGAHVVHERGQETGNASDNAADERMRGHLLANTLLVSAKAVQDPPKNPDAAPTTQGCCPREHSRWIWAVLGLLIVISAAAATLMAVFIPQGSTDDCQDGTQGGSVQGCQPNAALSYIPTTAPSLPPSLVPTFDPNTLRLRSVQSILVPISGLEVLLDTSTPQYHALEWVSLFDPLRLPYNTEAERKRVVQRYVLALLYYASGGEYWKYRYHFLEGIHECSWWNYFDFQGKVVALGVACTNGSEVDHLDMRHNNMTGTLPSELRLLTNLKIVAFAGNNLGGPIPEFNDEMTTLEELFLEGNSLTGTIPKSFGNLTSLQGLWLWWNMLNGTIPSALGQLSRLEELELHLNSLSGTIPVSFGNLSNLKKLWFRDNLLNGTIPSALGRLSNLQRLHLGGNSFTGKIPNELCQRKESGSLTLSVDSLTPNGTDFLCECFSVGDLSGCCVVRPDAVGDSRCDVDEPYNTAACDWDGRDCLVEDLPKCLGIHPSRIGDGYCDVDKPYNTEVCGYDGGDCPALCPKGTSPVAGQNMSECCVKFPGRIGNGQCNFQEPYNTAACGWDGGDCIVEDLPKCLGVRPSRIGDASCDFDEPYNTEACGYDGGDCCESTCKGLQCGQNGYDCKDPTVNITCLDAYGLQGCCVEYPSRIGDGHCHPHGSYYTEACKYDNGDCPMVCPEGTSPAAGKNMSECCVKFPGRIGDGWCYDYKSHNTAACGWDGGDCIVEDLPKCLGVHPSRIGNGFCDVNEPYNTEACGYDGGDCCESTCESWGCGLNGYDCKDPTVNITCLDADGLQGCCVEYPSHIGDGYCHLYGSYYTEACKYDNGDCPMVCPEGTAPAAGKNMSECCAKFPYYIGDGWCNDYESHNTAACGWDGGDCIIEDLPKCLGVNPFRVGDASCDFDEPYNTEACGYDGGDCCESTCEGLQCGQNGYDCKDPTFNITITNDTTR